MIELSLIGGIVFYVVLMTIGAFIAFRIKRG